MQIKLANKIEITHCGVTKTFYNTVLPGIYQKLLSGEDYTAYIAFGSDTHQNLNGVTALKALTGVKKSILCGINRDIAKGQIYIKKQIELNGEEYNGVRIKEVALTSSQTGSNIINYILLPFDGIIKQQGQSLIITATIYLTLSGGRTGSICGGENPLIDILFGLKKASLCDIKGIKSDGIFYGDGMPRNQFSGSVIGGANVGISGEALQITLPLPANCDCTEILLTIDGIPAISFSAKNMPPVYRQKQIKFNNGFALADEPGVIEVLAVNVDGEQKSFEFERAAESTCDAIKNPFDIVLKPEDKVYSSPDGNYMCIYGGDCIFVYYTGGGSLKKMNIYYINFAVTDILHVMLDNGGNMFVRIKSHPYFRAYYNSGGNLYTCTTQTQFSSNIIYTAMSQYGVDRYLYFIHRQNNRHIYTRCKAVISNGTYSQTVESTKEGDLRHFYSEEDGREILYNKEDNTFTLFPPSFNVNQIVLQKLKDCTEADIYGENLFINNSGKISVYNIESGEQTSLYDSGIRKIFYGKGIAIKLYANNNISALVCGKKGKELYPFLINNRISGEIRDIKILRNGILVCAKTRFSDCYYMPFSQNRVIIHCPFLEGQSESLAHAMFARKTFFALSGTIRCSLKLV